ncbi:MAG: coproporphyrinogen III oxidase, partial [Planctomycetota bacterium]
VTIYQMELPFNTVYSADILGNKIETPVADWQTKRDWLNYAFDEFLDAGYHISSGYTVVKDPKKVNFSYRDNLWKGSDLLATGIASFGHVSGVHYQNKPKWDDYVGDLLERSQLPLGRAFRPTPHQCLVREVILNLKKGYLEVDYFNQKYNTDILDTFETAFAEHQANEMLVVNGNRVELTREGILRVDGLLPAFFEPDHQGIRYT